jgi:hypothetical protein
MQIKKLDVAKVQSNQHKEDKKLPFTDIPARHFWAMLKKDWI